MENKKLLKFLLKDLIELDELISEKKENSFDEMEMEFLQTRVSGAKRMIQILHDREGLPVNKVDVIPEPEVKDEEQFAEEIIEEPVKKTPVLRK